MPMRIVAHLDMDAFYASVELLRYPHLRGRPLVIGGRRTGRGGAGSGEAQRLRDYAGRGVITTATYEARALGLRSGMGLMKAAQLAPDALLLPADFEEYRLYSRLFKDAVRGLVPQVEDRGIDEIYIDFTAAVAALAEEGSPDPWARARVLGLDIQRAVREATGLTCSIGITPNKLLAKIASELEKPRGLTVLREQDVEGRVWPLPVARLNGVGPRAQDRLRDMGVTTIGALARMEPAMLITRFGAGYGAWLHAAANGRDDRLVVTHSEPKSVSRETTFDADLHPVKDRARLSRIFTDLCVRVSGDLRRKGIAGRTIGVKLRFDNFRTVTRDRTHPAPMQDAQAIRRAAGECLKRVALDRPIRLLGVRVGELSEFK